MFFFSFIQWRLKALWTYLHSIGMSEMEFDLIWNRMEDAVIKSVLVAYKEMQEDFRKMTKSSVYNCYKLLGFDLLLDEDLKVHVIEANARPALLDDHLDKAVNRPMVSELLRIVGYHIPPSVGHHQDLIRKKFNLTRSQKLLTFERKMYCRVLSLSLIHI